MAPKKRQSPFSGLCLGWRVGLMVNVATGSLGFLLMGCLFYFASCLYLKTSHSAVLVPGANLTISLFQEMPERKDARTPEKFII